jgi:hypothetical protein
VCDERIRRDGSGRRFSDQPFLGKCGNRIYGWTEACHADEWRGNNAQHQQYLDYRDQCRGLFDIQQDVRNDAGSFSQLCSEHSFSPDCLWNAHSKLAI